MGKVNDDLSPLVRTPGQDSELNKLQDLLDRLTEVYNAKKGASENSIDPNNAGEKHTLITTTFSFNHGSVIAGVILVLILSNNTLKWFL